MIILYNHDRTRIYYADYELQKIHEKGVLSKNDMVKKHT
jgi:hypothetical protein